MTPRQAIEAFVLSIVRIEVEKLLPAAAKLVPGVAGQLLSSALSLPEVQAKIEALETAGVDKLVELLAEALANLGKYVESHVSGQLKAVVEAALSAPQPVLHLTAEQVRTLAALAAAGKLEALLVTAARDFLGAP